MKDLIGYCGLDCESCEARRATIADDDALRREVAKKWSALNGAEITPEMINCTGCRVAGVKTPYCADICPIRKCASEKQFASCGSRDSVETCEKLAMITKNNPEALKNLRT